LSVRIVYLAWPAPPKTHRTICICTLSIGGTSKVKRSSRIPTKRPLFVFVCLRDGRHLKADRYRRLYVSANTVLQNVTKYPGNGCLWLYLEICTKYKPTALPNFRNWSSYNIRSRAIQMYFMKACSLFSRTLLLCKRLYVPITN